MNNKQLINGYLSIVGDLLTMDIVDSMKNYNHHGKITTHFHSVHVSYKVYKTCVNFNIEPTEIVRASLLHDFYLYDWHITKHEQKHAWYHPKASVKNIEKYIGTLTPMQKYMILRHMWPLSVAPPNSLGGYILTFTDKHCANLEFMGLSHSFDMVYNEICERVDNLC